MVYLKIFKKKTVSTDDLRYLNELLKSNLSIQEALLLIKDEHNQMLIDEIINKLDSGQTMENVIGCYMNKEIGTYMNSYLKSLSFKESLSLSMATIQKEKENIQSISKDIAYPVVLFFVAISALFLFDRYGLDAIVNLLKSFQNNTSSIMLIRNILRIIITTIYILFILVLFVLLYFVSPKRLTLFYLLLSKYFPNSLLSIYFTEDFISLFLVALSLGYKTKEALEILKGLHNRPVISFMAFHMEEQLLNGSSLNEAAQLDYYDKTLSRFIQIASYSNDFMTLMKSYLSFCTERIKTKMKSLRVMLQTISYIAIGTLIVFVYQILFLPMQLLSKL